MANKIRFDNDYYITGGSATVKICISVLYEQHGVTNIYLDGVKIGSPKPGDFCEEINVKSGTEILVITTVADINTQHDYTGVDVNITGGPTAKYDPHRETADKGDIVTYHLSYIMV